VTGTAVTPGAAATYDEMDHLKDQECHWARLMRAANAGDEPAYARLLAGIAPTLRGQIRRGLARLGSGPGDVEDILQETLLAIHLKRHTWKETEAFAPWMRAIARNKLIDSLRRRGRRVDLPIEDFSEILAAPEEEPKIAAVEADRMLNTINGRSREVVRAIAIDGLSTKEAASRLGVSEGAIRVALHRGLAALAQAFRKTEP
jgi:RNA polymerase sigma-70 factor (ECF subfamily)